MTKKIFLSALLALFAASFLAAQSIGYDDFYRNLAPYGQWIEIGRYGWVWSPAGMPADWRPYSDGWWVYSDYGWTFESDQPYAWAVYHYGRWLDSDDYGWLWVPGVDWAPAWVAWRYGDQYVGWAPLPPDVGWSDSSGLVLGRFSLDTDIFVISWIFVDRQRFLEPRVRDYIFRPDRNYDYLRRTRNVTHYSRVDRKIFNPGIPFKDAERFTGRKIVPYRVFDSDKRDDRQVKDNQIHIYRPPVNKRITVNPRDLPDNRKWGTADDLKRKHLRDQRPVDVRDNPRDKNLPPPKVTVPPRKDVFTPKNDVTTSVPPRKDVLTPKPSVTPKREVTPVDVRKRPDFDKSKQPNNIQPNDKNVPAKDDKKTPPPKKLKKPLDR